MKNSIWFLSAIIFLSNVHLANAQGWERRIDGGGNDDRGFCIQQTADGGYIAASNATQDIFFVKLDMNGQTLWTQRTPHSADTIYWGQELKSTTDGGFILVGAKADTAFYKVLVMKLDAYGNILWQYTYGGNNYSGNSVQETSDGYIIAGRTVTIPVGTTDSSDVYVMKIDFTGNLIWEKTFGGTKHDAGAKIRSTADNNFIIAGETESFTSWDDVYLIKIDGLGNLLWEKYFDLGSREVGTSVDLTSDGGFIISGLSNAFNGGDCILVKTDQDGNMLWQKNYGGLVGDVAYSVQQTADGGYIAAGYTFSFGNGQEDIYLFKVNAAGDTVWTKTFGTAANEMAFWVEQTNDGGYILTGFSGIYGVNSDIYIIKTDSLGNSLTNLIAGNIFGDSNNDCALTTGERKLKNYIVHLDPTGTYATANDSGYYSFLVDSGTYTVSQISSSPYLSGICPLSHTVIFPENNFLLSDTNDFANQYSINCPLMWVDVSSSPLIRPCRQSTYSVKYCNNGTTDGTNAYIEIEFDENIIPIKSVPLMWSSANGNIYHWDLGTVPPGDCKYIYITDSVSCNAIIGTTVCAKAIIYPDTVCTPVDTTWDKSSLVVSGECVGDSLACFTILNHGSSMTGNTQYRIYANDTLIQTITFQLNADDSIYFCIAAYGKTIRVEADQRPGHPGKSRPRATVEGCGTPSSFGFVTTVPEDDEDDFVEIDCQTVRASCDPNEKLVKPTGITANRYISAKDELEYQINFQNTGNDTAFLIVVRDTLNDNVVDIGSVVSGVSSHPYSFRIYGQGILEWKFQNILLPDSNINEAESHGFVKFKVNQVNNNPKGTVISNHAGIYFDFNAPVLTADATVTVYDTVFQATGIKQLSIDNNPLSVKVYPNPFSNTATIRIMNTEQGIMNYELKIYDLLGREVHHQALSTKHEILSPHLLAGIYFYKVSNAQKEIIGSGKVVIE